MLMLRDGWIRVRVVQTKVTIDSGIPKPHTYKLDMIATHERHDFTIHES